MHISGLDPARCASSSTTGEAARRSVTLDHEQHRAGDVDEQRVGLVLDRGLGGVARGHRDRPGLGVPGLQRGRAGEREQGGAAVLARHQHGGHVAGLVVGQARVVVLHLTEQRDDRHQQARVLQPGQGGPVRVAVIRRRVVRRERGGQPGSTSPSSPAKPGSGMVRIPDPSRRGP